MEVDDDDGRLRARLVDELVHDLPRRGGRVDEEVPENVDDADGDAVARLDHREPATRKLRARVRGTDDALTRREIRADAVAPERVVAERDDVRAGGEQPVGEPAGDAGAVGDVLAVHDADVEVELVGE